MTTSSPQPQPEFSWEACLQFLPRPLLLRHIANARESLGPDFKEEFDKLFVTVSLEKMDSPQVTPGSQVQDQYFERGDTCLSGFTLAHDIVCGHTIATNFPTNGAAKEPCGPNCVRYTVLKSTGINMEAFADICDRPFLCSVCIEEFVRNNYARVSLEYENLGSYLGKNFEYNVTFYTRHLIQRCVRKHEMRAAQGLVGVFKLEQLDRPVVQLPLRTKNLALDVPKTLADASAGHEQRFHPYSGEGRRRGRDRRSALWDYRERSRSPEIEDADLNNRGTQATAETPSKNKVEQQHDRLSESNMSITQTRKKYRRRSPPRKTNNRDADLDELADRLLDAKVGLEKEDTTIASLLSGFGAMSTGK